MNIKRTPKHYLLLLMACFFLATYESNAQISQPQPCPGIMTISFGVIPPTCNNNKGTATAIPNCGYPPFSYAWSNGNLWNTIINVPPGNYTVTVTDSEGQQGVATVNIPAAPLPVIGKITANPSVCTLPTNLTGSATGGTGSYKFKWNTGATTASISVNTSGIYTVTITDAVDATCKDTVSINVGADVLNITVTTTPVLCKGDSTGSATASVTGGSAPYTFIWNNNAATPTISNVPAGAYFVTVTDANGCSSVAITIITAPPALLVNLMAIDKNCDALLDTLRATASGGVPPYTYTWNNNLPANTTQTNLPAGTYVVTATDQNGCTAKDTLIYTPPIGIASVIVSTTPTGTPENFTGTATANVTGGTAPYTYVWSNNETTQTIDSLPAGTYCVTVTDVNGCTETDCGDVLPDTMGVPPLVVDIAPVAGPGCPQDSVKLMANGSGGIPPYTYLWYNGATTAMTFVASGDTASVILTDAVGTMAFDTFVVPVYPALVIDSFNVVNNVCFGDTSGSATVNASGGTPPYTYEWSNSDTTQTVINLGNGTYVVTVTDIFGCTVVDTVEITSPPQIETEVLITNQVCSGDSTSSATVVVSGGVAPYTYLWCNGSTTASATNLPFGSCVVTVTDANGCVVTDTAIIDSSIILNVVLVVRDSGCDAILDSLIAVVTGGTAPYTYTWDNGLAPVSVQANLAPGTYAVTVTDINGCTDTASYQFVTPIGITSVTVTTTPTGIPENFTGTATANVTGGTAPYTYLWNNNETTQTIDSLPAGQYCVTVTDVNGCTETNCGNVPQDTMGVPPLVVEIDPVPGSGCPQDSVKLMANGSGGIPPYTYLWDNGNTTAMIFAALGDTVSVKLTDAAGSMAFDTFVVPVYPALVIDSFNVVNNVCFGDTSGSATVNASGGTPPYTYEWSNSGTTQTVINLGNGTYVVTVTDLLGCTVVDSVQISSPTQIETEVLITNLVCAGDSSSSATIVVSGGVGPYTYLWCNNSTTSSVTNLPFGTCVVTVTDANGCVVTDTAIIDSSIILNVTLVVRDSGCDAILDSLIAVVTGGTAPYTYTWDNNLPSISVQTNLAPGTYSVTVSDINGCTDTASYQFNTPTGIGSVVVTTTPTGIPEDSTGTATANVTGGTAPYTYVWSNNETTQTIDSLPAGTYCVTVTDVNGCTETDCGDVLPDTMGVPPLVVEIDPVPGSGCPQDSVKLMANGSGGIPPYTYLWDNGATTAMIFAALGDTVSVKLTDAAGSMAFDTFVVPVYPALVIDSFNVVNNVCFGDTTGSATVNASGGTPPYTYEWSNSDTTQTVTNLGNGTYVVTVTDLLGCTVVDSVQISSPPQIVTDITVTNPLCTGDTLGSATVVVSGGVGPYTYLWCNDDTTASATNLPFGTCVVTVTDANGCVVTDTAIIDSSVILNVTLVVRDSGCDAILDSLIAVVTGGVAPYMYTWDNNLPAVSVQTNLAPGTYSVTVTDINGCTDTASYQFVTPIGITSVTVTTTPTGIPENFTGTATANVTGGTAPYTYLWNNNETTQTIDSLPAGQYCVTVTDVNGCTETDCGDVMPDTMGVPPLVVEIDPVPGSGCPQDSVKLMANGSGGIPPYTYLWDNGATTAMIFAALGDTVSVKLTDAAGSMAFDTFVVPVYPALVIDSFNVVNNVCFGDTTGSATVNASGGTPPYTYEWSNSDTTQTVTNLGNGTYVVTVTDIFGCTVVDTVEITSPPQIETEVLITNQVCSGDSTSSATVVVSGGVAPYTYLWCNGSTTASATNLPFGTCVVTVTDANGCVVTDTAIIDSSSILNVTLVVRDSGCDAILDSLIAVVTGGTAPYTYTWDNGLAPVSVQTNLAPGTYSVTVTDINGCTDTASYQFNTPTGIGSVVVTTTPTGIPEDSTGTATANVTGGEAPYTYVWSNGETTQTIDSLPAGTYCVTVTDVHGCTETDCGDVLQDTMAPEPLMLVANQNQGICGDTLGRATATATGGMPPYTFVWDNTETGPTADSLTAGTHTVTVTDANGQTAVDSVLIILTPNTLVITPEVISPACASTANGSIVIKGSGGTTPYTFNWTPSATGTSINNLSPGNYTVTMTDAVGCTLVDTFTVGAIDSVQIALTLTPAACPGTDNGLATATPTPANGNYTYQWNLTGQTDSIVWGLMGGTMVAVTITDQQNGCIGTATGVIPQGEGPTVQIDPTDATCIQENNGSATALAAGGTPGYGYCWSTSPTDTSCVQTLTGLAPGVYTVTVSDANGCTASDTVAIRVQSHPNASFSYSAICLPNNLVNITLADISTDSTSSIVGWTWTVTSGTTTTFNGQGPINFPVVSGASVQVVLEVTSAAGCIADTVANFVAPASPNLNLTVDNSPNCGGIADTITVNTEAGNTVTFDPQTGITPGLNPNEWYALPDTQTSYTVTVSNGLCLVTDLLTVTPAVSVEINAVTGVQVDCDSVLLTATVLNGLPSVIWFDQNGNNVGQMNPILLPIDSTTTFSVQAGDSQGCIDTAAVAVTPEGVNLFVSDNALSGCEGDTLSMFVTNIDPNDVLFYAWSTNNPGLVILGPSDANTVSVTGAFGTFILTGVITNQLGCTETINIPVTLSNGLPAPAQAEVVGDGCSLSVQFAAAGNLAGTWIFGDSQQANVGDTLYTYAQAGVYFVVFVPSATCVANFDTVINLYNVQLEPVDTAVCAGLPVGLNPNGNPNYTYIWTAVPADASLTNPNAVNPVVQPTQTTVYSVVATFGTCSADTSLTVTILEAPVMALSDTSAICFEGQPLALEAQSTVVPQWADNSTFNPVIGSGQTITVDNPVLGQYYYARAVGTNGCATIDSTLALNAGVGLNAQNGTVCTGGDVQLQLQNTNPWQILVYNWNPAVDSTLIVSPDSNTTYTVTATNAWGCTAEASIFIGVVNLEASAKAKADVAATYPGGQIELQAFPDGAGFDYSWEPESLLDNPRAQTTTATLQETTLFTVTVTDGAGCSDTAQVQVRVGPCEGPYIFVPKAFTPNGDFNNDFFKVHSIEGQVSELYFVVYSRWGEEMYVTRDINHSGWDGRYNGDIQTPDTYGWYLEIRCPGGELAVLKGNVTLIK